MESTGKNELLNPEPPQPTVAGFSDLEGRRWTLKVTIGAVKRIREGLQLDLFAAADGGMFKELAAEPEKICAVIWALIHSQAKAADVDEAAFWDAVDDTVLNDATTAFFEALVDFFHADKREPLRIVLRKMKAAEAKQVENMTAVANSPKLDAKIEAMLEADKRNAMKGLEPGGD